MNPDTVGVHADGYRLSPVPNCIAEQVAENLPQTDLIRQCYHSRPETGVVNRHSLAREMVNDLRHLDIEVEGFGNDVEDVAFQPGSGQEILDDARGIGGFPS